MKLQDIFNNYIEQATEGEVNPLLKRDLYGVIRIHRLVNVRDSDSHDTLLHIVIKALDTYQHDPIKYSDCLEILSTLRLDYYHYTNVFITNLAGETAYDLLKKIPPNPSQSIDILNHYPNKFLIAPGTVVVINDSDDLNLWSKFNDIAKGGSGDTTHLPVYTTPNRKDISAIQMAVINGYKPENDFNSKKNKLIYRALNIYNKQHNAASLENLLTAESALSSIIPSYVYQIISLGLDQDVVSFELITAAIEAIKKYAPYRETPVELINRTVPDTTKTLDEIQAELSAQAKMQDAVYALAEHTQLPILDSFLKTYPKTDTPEDILRQKKRDLIGAAIKAYLQDSDITILENLIKPDSESRKIIRKPLGDWRSYVYTDYDTTSFNLITAAITAARNNAANKQDALEALAAYADMPVSRKFLSIS